MKPLSELHKDTEAIRTVSKLCTGNDLPDHKLEEYASDWIKPLTQEVMTNMFHIVDTIRALGYEPGGRSREESEGLKSKVG